MADHIATLLAAAWGSAELGCGWRAAAGLVKTWLSTARAEGREEGRREGLRAAAALLRQDAAATELDETGDPKGLTIARLGISVILECADRIEAASLLPVPQPEKEGGER